MKHSELLKFFLGPAMYQITVEGKVDPRLYDEKYKLKVTHIESKEQTLSVLTGEIKDQLALNHILNLMYNSQYDVISITKLRYN
jgi:hypothetical protein